MPQIPVCSKFLVARESAADTGGCVHPFTGAQRDATAAAARNPRGGVTLGAPASPPNPYSRVR